MRKASVYQTKNNLNSKEIEKELDVLDYVFEIAGKDITKVRVAYFFDKIEKVTYQDGKRRLEQEPLLILTLKGKDPNQKEVSLTFELRLSLATLNSYKEETIVDLTPWIVDILDEKGPLDFYLPTHKIEDMYHKLTTVSVVKLNNNYFLFKVFIPTENIFVYFKSYFE